MAMNERIKGLYDQADKFASQNRVQNIGAPGNNYFELFHEKFAELIVKECADFLKDELDDHFAAEQLEEHFGVEE
jgi:hypothetical protein